MDEVRIAVVGTKGMGRGHIRAIQGVERARLSVLCDVDAEEARKAGEEFGVPHFGELKEMLRADVCDAVSVCTPHWFHPPITIAAAKAGKHVLTEKPMAVTVADADKMIRACRKAGVVLRVIFQHRQAPMRRAVRKLIASGELGEVTRTMLVSTNCRTNFYYQQGGWRATWKGEGGGVLLNQAPHALDQLIWLTDMMPDKVYGVTETYLHPIEVEDRASAVLHYPNGATGYIHVSTTEVPGGEIIEVAGDGAKLVIDRSGVRIARLKTPMKEFVETSGEMWGRPEAEWSDVAPEPEGLKGHAADVRDFVASILDGADAGATGISARRSLELANAIILSSKTGKEVKLPLNRKAYADLMKKLIRKSGGKGKKRKKR